MLRRAFAFCAVLGLVSTANAGVVVTLVPSQGPPYDLNNPSSLTFQVDVLARIETAVPSPVPGNPGARLRLAQFDVGASSDQITITPVTTHTGIGEEEPFTTIEFWDFSSTSNCTNNPAACGLGYFIDGSLSDATPDILNMTFAQSASSGVRQVTLTTENKRLGVLQIALPAVEGTYSLDLLNSTATGDAGAEFRYGFGTATDPSVTFEASLGTVTGGQASFTVVPEPATLALLGIGGLAAAFRRRRSA